MRQTLLQQVTSWHVADRCQYCYCITGLIASRLSAAAPYVAWQCNVCLEHNVLAHPRLSERIPEHVKAWVLAGKPELLAEEPAQVEVGVKVFDASLFVPPPKQSWWRRAWAAIFR